MAWALVTNKTMEIYLPSETMQPPALTIVDSGIIANLIVYDGSSLYTPPENYKLVQVPDTAKIGDSGY